MKILFFIALLANIVFFLWEINSRGAMHPLEIDKALIESREILLVRELPNNQQSLVIKGVNNKIKEKEKKVPTNKEKVKKELALTSSSENKAKPNEQATLTSQKARNNEASANQTELIIPELIDAENNNDQPRVQVNNEKNKDELKVEQEKNNSENIKENKEKVEDKTEVKDQKNKPISEQNSKPKDTHERSQDRQQSEKKETKQVENNDAITYCHRIGPFKDQAELQQWAKNNKINNSNLKQINKAKNTISGYLVYYPAEDTLENSRKNIDVIKQKGVSDIWLFENDELEGVISLGLFKTESRAIKLKNSLEKKDVKAKIMQRFAKDASFYAQIDSDNKKLNDNFKILEGHSVSKCKI